MSAHGAWLDSLQPRTVPHPGEAGSEPHCRARRGPARGTAAPFRSASGQVRGSPRDRSEAAAALGAMPNLPICPGVPPTIVSGSLLVNRPAIYSPAYFFFRFADGIKTWDAKRLADIYLRTGKTYLKRVGFRIIFTKNSRQIFFVSSS